jgi:hypothetical protein
METPTRPLTLSGLEVVYLTDSVRNKDTAEGLPDREAYVPVGREALLLLGSAYGELVSSEGVNPGPVTLQVSEEIAWLLRDKVRTGDLAIDGQTNVGISLLLKLFEVLNSFTADVPGLPPMSTHEDREFSAADRQYLSLLKEGSNARGKPHQDADTDPDPGS